MKPSTVLKKARKLIERGWCKGPSAMNAAGEAVSPDSRSACRWCIYGALVRVGKSAAVDGYVDDYLTRAIGTNTWFEFNETRRSKRPVLRAFDRAIKLAEKEGQ